jgi:hypothetical protein
LTNSETMKKIIVTAACVLNGEHQEAGTVLELDPVAAAEALASGRCEAAPTYAKIGPGTVEHRDPDATDRDPKPATKRGKKAPEAPAADPVEPEAPAADPVAE